MRYSILYLLAPAILSAQTTRPAVAEHPLFGAPAVHDIYIEFKQPDYWQQLTTNYRENSDDIPYIEASFTLNGFQYEKIGVRFKGNSSYRGATTDKKPFRIKLNEFTKGQKIGGAASFNLNNLWNDPSFIREKLYFDLAAKLGLRTPRSNFANLYINGKYWGLYGLGEVINGDFVESRYEKADQTGNLYKAASPGATLDYLGDDVTRYAAFYEKKTNESDTTWSDLIDLTRQLKEIPEAERYAKLSAMLDVDSVLMALALDNLTVNLDSYVGMAQNYFIYKRPTDGKWEWLPWDPSLAFGALTFGVAGDQMSSLLIEWTATTNMGQPGLGGGGATAATRPLATVMWSVPEFRTRYREIYRRLVEEVLIPDYLMMDARYLQDLLRPHMQADPNKLTSAAAYETALSAPLPVAGALPGGGGPGGPIGPGGPGGPGGGAPGGSSAPGIETLTRARDQSVRKQLNQ